MGKRWRTTKNARSGDRALFCIDPRVSDARHASGTEIDNLHTPVAGFRCLRTRVDHRAFLAHAHRFQAGRLNVELAGQVGDDGFRPALRQRAVFFARPDIVGMAFDAEPEVRQLGGGEGLAQGIERSAGGGRQIGGPAGEVDGEVDRRTGDGLSRDGRGSSQRRRWRSCIERGRVEQSWQRRRIDQRGT